MEQLPPNSTSLIAFLLLILFIVPFIFYLVTLQKTLKAISPENRKLAPSQVWLLFIPLFGILWHFMMVSKIADSIRAESLVRDIELKESRPAYSIGLAMCILNCTSLLSELLGMIDGLSGVAFIICWIIYWVKIASYKKQIINSSLITLDAEAYSSTIN